MSTPDESRLLVGWQPPDEYNGVDAVGDDRAASSEDAQATRKAVRSNAARISSLHLQGPVGSALPRGNGQLGNAGLPEAGKRSGEGGNVDRQ